MFSRYEVWRNDDAVNESPGDPGTTYQRIQSFDDITVTNFTDAGDELEGGQQFAYRIVLVDLVGRRAISNEIVPSTTPP